MIDPEKVVEYEKTLKGKSVFVLENEMYKIYHYEDGENSTLATIRKLKEAYSGAGLVKFDMAKQQYYLHIRENLIVRIDHKNSEYVITRLENLKAE
jgi:hypothetical protein